jgi:putative ABC transport system permease protein
MNTLWRKAIRDFWHERARTALVVLAIALGISAFAAVLSSYAILTRELDLGYLATNPASAVIRVDSADDDLVKAILQNPEVSDAEPRRTISGQIKAGPAQWRNLILFVVNDYGNIRVTRLVPESGARCVSGCERKDWRRRNGEDCKRRRAATCDQRQCS